jgi:hypothetical protein
MSITVKLEGGDRLRKILVGAPRTAATAFGQALRTEAEHIMAESKNRVPFDTGTLSGSGRVFPTEVRRGRVSVELGYGGAASAYALAVHEHPSEHSPRSWSGTVNFSKSGPKFLERPVMEAAAGFGSRVGQEIGRVLGRQG